MTPEPEENRLDQSLRGKFERYAPPPSGTVWPGIAPHIGPPPMPRRRRPLPLPFLFGLTALLAGLGGWLLPHEAAMKPAMVKTNPNSAELNPGLVKSNSSLPTSNPDLVKSSPSLSISNPGLVKSSPSLANVSPGLANLNPNLAGVSPGLANSRPRMANLTSLLASRKAEVPRLNAGVLSNPAEGSVDPPAAAVATDLARGGGILSAPLPADALPVTLRPLAALERQTLERLLPGTGTPPPGPLPADRRAALLGGLRAERAELRRLQRRADSLLLAWGGGLPGAPALAARADSAQAETGNQRPSTSRWSLLLAATPEQNTLALQGPEGDSLTALRRNHETGRAGVSATVGAEYQLTPRLGVGGGVGYTAFGADLRVTNKTTDVRVAYHTTSTTNTAVYTSVNQTYSIRLVQVPQLSPVFNGSGQVIRYDTVYVPRRDTVYSTTIQHDTVRTTNHVTTPSISKKETLTTKLLQPNYRFFTVPVLLRYRLAAPGTSRLWTDVALGAQLQFFLGGTQVVTDDGEHFRTERISVASSPFRALNVALSGALALNYALTPRLSVSVAPSLRWQALSLYKPETGLRQQATATGVLFGVRFQL